MSVILLIIILAVLVLSHEFGHFIVAKLSGIKVLEFGLGLPPRAYGKKIGETIYSLNWIPFGGYVRIHGEDSDSPIPDLEPERSISRKPRLVQAAVIVAGIVFNILLASVLIWVGLQAGLPVSVADFADHESDITNHRVIVTAVVPGSPADEAQIPPGTEISNFETPEALQDYVSAHKGENVEVVTPDKTYILLPEPILGIEMDFVGDAHLSPIQALPSAVSVTYRLTTGTAGALATFIDDALKGEGSLEGVVGPVGIAGIVGEASKHGFISLLLLTAILSLSLAVINLVPFPALDGGRLLFVIIEAIKGSPIKQKIANTINVVGFSLLIILMLVITYRDIAKLV